jgi:crotonobetainyl-CoA:carnitine CoA-transferase CaiB-like acyl-CoA transferase
MSMSDPLDGIRVVDAAVGIAGPYCCLQLADAGARVSKLEVGEGDMTRQWAPQSRENESIPFRTLNRAKHPLWLDLSQSDAHDRLEQLVVESDVLVVDADGPILQALPWERARELSPGLVYCVISGWGPSGPWANQPAGELSAQLASEFTSSFGRIGEPPVRAGTDVAGMFAGIHAVQAITAALIAGLSTGRGDRVEVSLFGSLLTMRSTLWVALSRPDEWWGFHLDNYVKPPFGGFRCADGTIYFELRDLSDQQREQLLHDLGITRDSAGPKFDLILTDRAGGSGRYTHELMEIWEAALAKLTCTDAIEIIERHGGVALPANDFAAAVHSDQAQHLGTVGVDNQVRGEPLPLVRQPWSFTPRPTSPPPITEDRL